MRLYSVYLKHHGRRDDGDMILVKEGFSWPAFVFSFLWALASRMWLAAAGIFLTITVVGLVMYALNVTEMTDLLVTIALAVAIGWVGNDLRRWTLERKGYDEVAVVSGKNLEDATRRFLDQADITERGVFP